MRPIATDVARSVVTGRCVGHTGDVQNNAAELIGMPFGGLTHVDPRNHVLDGIQMPQGRGNFFGGDIGDNMAMRPLDTCFGLTLHKRFGILGELRGNDALIPPDIWPIEQYHLQWPSDFPNPPLEWKISRPELRQFPPWKKNRNVWKTDAWRRGKGLKRTTRRPTGSIQTPNPS